VLSFLPLHPTPVFYSTFRKANCYPRTENETAVLRWDYGDPSLGTCQETIQGGNHFRYWVQSGTSGAATGGASGAYFLATSYEKPIALGHDIIVDGYNQGR
jgi:hypothetical protein